MIIISFFIFVYFKNIRSSSADLVNSKIKQMNQNITEITAIKIRSAFKIQLEEILQMKDYFEEIDELGLNNRTKNAPIDNSQEKIFSFYKGLLENTSNRLKCENSINFQATGPPEFPKCIDLFDIPLKSDVINGMCPTTPLQCSRLQFYLQQPGIYDPTSQRYYTSKTAPYSEGIDTGSPDERMNSKIETGDQVYKDQVALYLAASFPITRFSLEDGDRFKVFTYISNSKNGMMLYFPYVRATSVQGRLNAVECTKDVETRFGNNGDQWESIVQKKDADGKLVNFIQYDPRCRPWFNAVLEFIESVKTGNKKEYEFFIPAEYAQIDRAQQMTICATYTFNPETGTKILEGSQLICKDLELNQVITLVARSFAVQIFQFLAVQLKIQDIDDIDPSLDLPNIPAENESPLSKSQMKRYYEHLIDINNDSTTSSSDTSSSASSDKTCIIRGICSFKPSSTPTPAPSDTTNDNGGEKIVNYQQWITQLSRLKEYNNIGFSLIHRDKDLSQKVFNSNLGDVNFTENFRQFIIDSEKLDGSEKSLDLKFEYLDQNTNIKSSYDIKVQTISIRYKGRPNDIEFLKIAFVFPTNLIQLAFENVIDKIVKNIIFYIIIFGIAIALIFCTGLGCIYSYGINVNKDLNLLLKLIYNIQQEKKEVRSLAESKYWNWYSMDTAQVYNAFLKVEKIILQALKFDSVSENEAFFMYAHCIKIFEALGNSRLLSIVYNNQGNHHFKLENYQQAIQSFTTSIRILDNFYEQTAFTENKENSLKEDDYINIKFHRQMNLVLVYWELVEKDQNSRKDLEKLSSLLDEILQKDTLRDINYWRQVFLLCLRCYIERENNFTKRSVLSLKKATEILPMVDETIIKKDYLQQEIYYQQILHYIKFQQSRQAAETILEALTKHMYLDLHQKERLFNLMVKVFQMSKMEPTKGFKELRQNLSKCSNDRAFLLALDYSGSMKQKGKLGNSIKQLLLLWDNYLNADDHVAFVRFNLQVEKVFEFAPKYVNSFSRRHEIEKSFYPRDRTSLYDCLDNCMKMFMDRSVRDMGRKVLLLITDGLETSSINNMTSIEERLRDSNITLVIFGLNVKQDEKIQLQKLAQCSFEGIFTDLVDENQEFVLQAVTHNVAIKKFNLMTMSN